MAPALPQPGERTSETRKTRGSPAASRRWQAVPEDNHRLTLLGGCTSVRQSYQDTFRPDWRLSVVRPRSKPNEKGCNGGAGHRQWNLPRER